MQAKYYADGLEKEYAQRPVIFYTNGYEIFIWDDAKGEPPRAIFGFYSLDSLRYCIFPRNQREASLGALFPKEAIIDRLYQIECVKRTCENFDKRRRHALLIQATGTGKTRGAVALSELMIRAKWGKRILFLCDRRELRKQAGNTFDELLPSEPRVIVTRNTANDKVKRIYLATYPAMMKCFQNFDVGFFDLIIADESHRSIYNRFRDIFRNLMENGTRNADGTRLGKTIVFARNHRHAKLLVQQFPALNSNQIRFLELLKSQIATYGAIELDRLWEAPFTTLHAEGIDGIFPDSAQVDSLLDLLNNLNLTAA